MEGKFPNSRSVTARDFALVLCFFLFLYPVSVGGISVNYSFLLLPMVVILVRGKIKKPSTDLLAFIVFYAVIFVIATLYQYRLFEEWPRRALSFLSFMSVFSFVFLPIDERMVNAFKIAVVGISVYFSLSSIYQWYLHGGPALGFEAKDLVGGQRFGFVYVMAFWILYAGTVSTWVERLLRLLCISTVVAGILMTFSRASVVALLASMIFYLARSVRPSFSFSFGRGTKKIAVLISGVLLILAAINAFLPVAFEFFTARLFDFFLDRGAVEENFANSATSEGTRLFIWANILDFVASYPLTGAGYFGVWMIGDAGGSAHSQYFDVLLRAGIPGFMIYVYLLYRASRILGLSYPSLYLGFVGVLVYGLFHETFKEAHGGFLLAFLLGILSQNRDVKSHSAYKRRTLRVGAFAKAFTKSPRGSIGHT